MPLSDRPLGDHEYPSDDDVLPEGDEPGEMLCPHCRAEIIEDTQKCPHCGDWITPVHPSSAGWRRLVFVAIVLLMALLLLRFLL